MLLAHEHTTVLPTSAVPSPLVAPTPLPLGVVVLGVLLFSAILIGGLSLLLRHHRLPFGSVTLVLAALVGSLALMQEGRPFLVAAVAAGVLGDVLLAGIEHSPRNRATLLRWFCFTVPFAYEAFVLLVLHATGGVWWTIHVQAGLPVLAGLSGLLMSLVAWPPNWEESPRSRNG
jgi:hypothetical protein